MPNPTAAMIVIGDEILSGRTQDTNTQFLAQALTKNGITLNQARVIPDDPDVIVSTVRMLSAQVDYVFTSGGIGPTHDDITADCVAAAFNRRIDIRADARALLQAHYDKTGRELNAARLRMARIPEGADLIENPVSTAPGFIVENCHVMAGVPAVFQAMVASVLPSLTGGTPLLSETLRLEIGEGDLAGPLGEIANTHPDISIGSYPFHQNGIYGADIVLRSSDAHALKTAKDTLETLIRATL